MNGSSHGRLEIDFTSAQAGSGLATWRAQRRAALRETARLLGLPLGHRVEVRFRDGVRLEGLLELGEERLLPEESRDVKIDLRIDRLHFCLAEIESCVRLD